MEKHRMPIAMRIKYAIRYERPQLTLWLVLLLCVIMIGYDIGIVSTLACIIIWSVLWFVFSTLSPYIPSIFKSNENRGNKVDDGLYLSFTNMLSESEKYDMIWLLSVMTLPVGYRNEHCYYDAVSKELFHTAQSDDSPYIRYFDKFNREYPIHIGADLAVRLELINDDSSEIVEIPRFTVGEKVGIQLEFLSRLPNTYWHNELIAAVEQQQDTHKFVLDDVLIENDNSAPMAPYWDDYKLQVTSEFINKLLIY